METNPPSWEGKNRFCFVVVAGFLMELWGLTCDFAGEFEEKIMEERAFSVVAAKAPPLVEMARGVMCRAFSAPALVACSPRPAA